MDDFFAAGAAADASPQAVAGFEAEDPTADFLAREQAALGEDHAFVTGTAAGADFRRTPAEQQRHELPGSGAPAAPQFAVAAAAPDQGLSNSRNSNSSLERRAEEPESEAVREWRTRFAERVAERDRKSEQKHREQIEAAKQAIDRFYEEYNQRKQQAHAANRESETLQAAESASGTTWEKVAREVDAAANSQGKSAKCGPSRERFRELLNDLRKVKSGSGLGV